MNLSNLFEAQKELDARIVQDKGLDGQDLLSKKILALLVELGECANEWRGFKFWSNRQTPAIEKEECNYCSEEVEQTRPTPFMADAGASMCKSCWDSTKKEYAAAHDEYIPDFEDYPHFKVKQPKKLLEEYVDCLHFILSIGLEIGCDYIDELERYLEFCLEEPQGPDVTEQFNSLFDKVGDFSVYRNAGNYSMIFHRFVALGTLLGFNWDQIEQGYFSKNQVNHDRQSSGY